MPETAWEDEFTLLCERCGYVVEGLDPAGNCPECGKAIAESLPERRVGTAWEQAPSLLALLRGAAETLMHPRAVLDSMCFTEGPNDSLQRFHAAIASMTFFGLPLVALFGELSESRDPDIILPVILLIITGLVGWFVLHGLTILLTWIETQGLVFFGARRGARLTPTIARSITAHGGIGWVISGVGFTSCALLGSMLARLTGRATWAPIGLSIGLAFLVGGFLFFETFAWLGLRRCKFANRVRPKGTSPERE